MVDQDQAGGTNIAFPLYVRAAHRTPRAHLRVVLRVACGVWWIVDIVCACVVSFSFASVSVSVYMCEIWRHIRAGLLYLHLGFRVVSACCLPTCTYNERLHDTCIMYHVCIAATCIYYRNSRTSYTCLYSSVHDTHSRSSVHKKLPSYANHSKTEDWVMITLL